MKRKKLTAFILSAAMLVACCGTAFAQDDTENMPIEGEVIQETADTTEAPEDETAIVKDWAETTEEPTLDEVETADNAQDERITDAGSEDTTTIEDIAEETSDATDAANAETELTISGESMTITNDMDDTFEIAFDPYYEGGISDTWLFADEEVIFKVYNPNGNGEDLPNDCIIEWNLYSFDNEGNYVISTQTTSGDLYFTPTHNWYSITADVYYMDSDTDSANLIASCEKAYGVIENGYQEFYVKADIDQGEFNYTIKPGETINLIGYSVTYSTIYPNGYTAEAEIADVDVYANYIPTIDEDGDEDWVFDKTDEARYSIVSINGTKVTGVSYGEAELTIIFKDANGNNVNMGYSLFIDVDPGYSDSSTPAAGTGSSPTATNNGNSAATTGTNNIDSTTTTVADSTSNVSATTAAKTSDVNYMRYAILLLAALGAVTILCMRERKETN